MLAHLKRFYFEHVVPFFGGFGVKLIAQVSDIISDLMAYLLVKNTLPEIAGKAVYDRTVEEWALIVFLCTLGSSVLSIGCDLFEYLREHVARMDRHSAQSREEFQQKGLQMEILMHRTRVWTSFLHIPLLFTEDGLSMSFSLLMVVQFHQSFTSFFFLNLLISSTILVVLFISRITVIVVSVAHLRRLGRIQASDEEMALIGQPEAERERRSQQEASADAERDAASLLPKGVYKLTLVAWFCEIFVNETIDCMQDGVSSWQILKDPLIRSKVLLYLPTGTWALVSFSICLYAFMGTVATQIALHRRQEVLRALEGPFGFLVKVLLFPLIFPAAAVAGTLVDPQRTWALWRSGGGGERERKGKKRGGGLWRKGRRM